MAIIHGYNGSLEVASVDLSDHISEFELVESYNELDTTALGDTHSTAIAGLGSFTLSVTFHQDQAASQTYATLQPLVGTVATFSAKQDAGATSSTNRAISGSVLVTEFSHVAAAPDQLSTFSVTWPGTGTLTIATS